MSNSLIELDSKSKIDNVILFNIDKLVIIRFGNKNEAATIKLDDTVSIAIEINFEKVIFYISS